MPELRPGALLDVDGTLCDTNYLHVIAWSRALAEAGEWAPMNAMHRLIGMGGDRFVPELLGHEVEGASDAWQRHFEQLIPEIRAFPGAADLVCRLHDRGVVVVLATSSPSALLDVMVERVGADGAIDAVTTKDDVSASKPAPDIFLAALEAGGVDPERALCLGDSTWDVQAARAAGLGCVGVESGGFSTHELSEAGALHVYRDVREVADQLHTGPFGALVR
ncbi:MAG: HAD family hydrolase [Actinobacteria bacterium]|nr:HAD family hydrolase [Actinomycetota bacterium]